MINPKNESENNDITVAGTDLFADSESFLNEMTDSELVEIVGGLRSGANVDYSSTASLILCGDYGLAAEADAQV